MSQYQSTFDEAINRATDGVKFKTWPYTLDLLPVQGMTSNPTQSIQDTQNRLRDTLQIITGIRKGPYGLPQNVVQRLENIRFHVVNGLTLIDAARRYGHSINEQASVVDGLQAAIDNQVTAVIRARPEWKAWLADAHGRKNAMDQLPPPAGVANFGEFVSVGYGADPLDPTGGLVKATTLGDYLAIGIVAGGLLLLVTMAGK